jgi:glycosyltransferase
MKISVISVCLNSEKTIGLTIESFLAQNHAEKELVIIDGVSRDRTLEIARSFNSEQVRIFSEKDAGIYDAMNKGLRQFSGDAVGVIGSDDTFHDPTALARIAKAMERADIVYGDLYFVTDHVSKRAVRTYRPGKYRTGAFKWGWMPPHPTFYVRREVVDQVGLFDTRYRIGADYDYIVRAMHPGRYRDAYVPEILVDFQKGGVSTRGLFKSVLTQNREALDSRRRWLGAPPIDLAFFLKPARSFLQLNWR